MLVRPWSPPAPAQVLPVRAPLRWRSASRLTALQSEMLLDAHMDIRLLWNKQQNYLGSHLGNKGELVDAMRFVEDGRIRPVVGRILPLKELARAQHLMETAAVAGKIAIVPPGP